MSGSAAAPDLVVVGAGAMGTWTALRAVERGHRTLLIDGFGPGDPRATSGAESRILRCSHGSDEPYSRWARAAREAWIALGDEAGAPIFVETGVAWFAHGEDGFEAASERTLRALGVPVERLSPGEAAARWPAVSAEDLAFVVHEPEAGVLRARQGVRAAAAAFETRGGEIRIEAVRPPGLHATFEPGSGRRLEAVVTAGGERIAGDTFVFAAGPWLPGLFPDAIGSLISVTKQDVFWFGPPAGDRRFDAGRLPAWVDFDRAVYGIPALDGRGLKAAPDAYGRAFDPDTEDRLVDAATLVTTRRFLAERMPDLAGRPVMETRVCQYEATPDTHFVIDRHPGFDNVWLVGGGSGHGFKHAPEIGRYVLDRVEQASGKAPSTVGGSDMPADRFSVSRDRRPSGGVRSGADSPRPVERATR
jgi:sarcosine oxidase